MKQHEIFPLINQNLNEKYNQKFPSKHMPFENINLFAHLVFEKILTCLDQFFNIKKSPNSTNLYKSYSKKNVQRTRKSGMNKASMICNIKKN